MKAIRAVVHADVKDKRLVEITKEWKLGHLVAG